MALNLSGAGSLPTPPHPLSRQHRDTVSAIPKDLPPGPVHGKGSLLNTAAQHTREVKRTSGGEITEVTDAHNVVRFLILMLQYLLIIYYVSGAIIGT